MRIITAAISAVAAIAAFSLRSFGEVGMAKSAYEPGLGQGEILFCLNSKDFSSPMLLEMTEKDFY